MIYIGCRLHNLMSSSELGSSSPVIHVASVLEWTVWLFDISVTDIIDLY